MSDGGKDAAQEAPLHVANSSGGQFLIGPEGASARLIYQLRDGAMVIASTWTAPEARGGGLASTLMRAAVEHAQANGLRIDPVCSYADVWMRRHPQFAGLLED